MSGRANEAGLAPLESLVDVAQDSVVRAESLQAPALATSAPDGRPADGEVADLAGGTPGTAAQLAVDNEAGADPHANSDYDEVVNPVTPPEPLLGHGESVHVVVHKDRTAKALRKRAGHGDVPPTKGGRVAADPGTGLDKACKTDPDTNDLVETDTSLADRIGNGSTELVEHRGGVYLVGVRRTEGVPAQLCGPEPVQLDQLRMKHLGAEVGHRYRDVKTSYLQPDDVVPLVIDAQEQGWPAAARLALADLIDQPALDELGDYCRHCGGAETGCPYDVGA